MIFEIISFTDVDADLIIFSNEITRLAQYLCKSVACGDDEVLVLHQSQDSRWICIQMKLTAPPSENVSHAVFINRDLHAFQCK